jgi:predicted HicB family RNase H-like nuclease
LVFDGQTVNEVKKSFYSVVDEYIEDCAKEGVEPKKPFSGQFMTRLKPRLHQELFISAKKAGKSMNTFVEETLEEKLSANM